MEIIQERSNSVTQNIFRLPPLLLDSINKNRVIKNKHTGGYHVGLILKNAKKLLTLYPL